MKNIVLTTLLVTIFSLIVSYIPVAYDHLQDPNFNSKPLQEYGPWSEEKANEWYKQQDWPVGANYAPAYAINQLEMWQAETFDIDQIKKELAWAKELGFNTMRVFLHHLLWDQDADGFKERINAYLNAAEQNGIKTMFVLFDDVWDPLPKLGKQKDPTPHVHNSGWVQSPGVEILKDSTRYDELEDYVKGILNEYRDDDRVLIWDLYNEPGNENASSYASKELKNKHIYSLALMKKINNWAREIELSQPITIGAWTGDWAGGKQSEITSYCLEESDIISFHTYHMPKHSEKLINVLLKYKRPIMCTEYMARTVGNSFQDLLPLFEKHRIAAYNWGFVSGKSQTIYPWESWSKHYSQEPKIWFHDILRPNGTPFDKDEYEFVKKIINSN